MFAVVDKNIVQFTFFTKFYRIYNNSIKTFVQK